MVRYEAVDGRATLTIDQPHRRNPLSVKTLEGLVSGTRRALEDPEVRVLVYTGSGEQAFCAGADLDGGMFDDPVGLHRQRGALADLFRLMIRGGKPTIARVNGHALGGGFGLMCACDIVICVEDAKLGTPEVRVGVWPMLISAVLARTIPRRALLEMMMTGRLLTPAEALALGGGLPGGGTGSARSNGDGDGPVGDRPKPSRHPTREGHLLDGERPGDRRSVRLPGGRAHRNPHVRGRSRGHQRIPGKATRGLVRKVALPPSGQAPDRAPQRLYHWGIYA